jgi:hypothetical protein
MAFNPFHSFRKNQKTFMVILTILTMFIFVFSFGQGDAFTSALRWMGFLARRGQPVIKLYGETVTDYDLDRVRQQRKLAQDFVGLFMLHNQAEVVGKLIESKPGSENKGPLPPTLETVARDFAIHYYALTHGFGQQMPLRNLPEDLESIRREFALGTGKDAQRLSAIQSVAAMGAAYRSMMTGEPLFVFGGDTSNRDMLDFLIWKHQADKLGITLTDADVGKQVNLMFGNNDAFGDGPFERARVVQDFIQPTDRSRRAGPSATAQDLLEALRDEFRVQLAKEAILGHGSGWRYWYNRTEPTRSSPSAATPYEFLDYFRDQRTTLKVTLLGIATGNFVPEVKGQPTEEELRNLYEEYRDREPKPDDRTPGFKEPRRIRVQYLRVNPESPFYQKAGKAMAEALGRYSDLDPKHPWAAAMRVAAGFNAYNTGGFPAWAALAGLPQVFDPLEEEYRKYRSSWPQSTIFGGEALGIGSSLEDHRPAAERPETWVSVLGQVFGAEHTGVATPLAAASVLPGLEAQLRQATLRAFGSSILACGSGSPLSALALPMPFTEAPLPRDVIWPTILERYGKDVTAKLANDNLAQFRGELAKLRSKPAEEEPYIRKAVEQFGFEDLTTMGKVTSIYDLVLDPDLKKLKEAFIEYINKMSPGSGGREDIFAGVLAQGNTLYEAEQFSDVRSSDRGMASTWSFWRIEDKAPRRRTFDEVRAEVEHAWRLSRARRLAQKKADELKQTINEKKMSFEDALRYLRDQKLGNEFELDRIARLLAREGAFLPGSSERADFRPYQVPRDKIAYPPDDILDRLMTLKEPGQALVFADKPGQHFYVVVLESRSPPSWREFTELYGKRTVDDPLYQAMEQKRDHDLDQELMKQLRLEAATAGSVDEQGNIKIPEGVRGEQSGREQT